MNAFKVQICRTDKRVIDDQIALLLDQLGSLPEIGGGAPAIDLRIRTLSPVELVDQLHQSAVHDQHYCLLLDKPPAAAAAEAVEAPLDAWMTFPADLMPASLADLPLVPTLVLVPPALWSRMPRCPSPKEDEDPGIYFQPGDTESFRVAHQNGDLAGFAADKHLKTVATVLGNCRIDGECPGVLGCWPLPAA